MTMPILTPTDQSSLVSRSTNTESLMKRIVAIAQVLFLISIVPAMAQTGWVQLSSGTSNNLYGVVSVSTTMTLCVGATGTIRGTSNSGTSWLPGVSGTVQHLRKVFVSGLTIPVITVVGDGGTILQSANGGVTWTPRTSGTSNHLLDIFVHDPLVGTTMTAVGANGTILVSTNSGVNWSAQSSGSTADLRGVFYTDLNNGYAAGDGGTLLMTTNMGTNWSAGNSGTSQTLNGVFFTDAGNGTMVGTGQVIRRTTDAGQSWSAQSAPAGTDFNRVFFTDANTGTLVGDGGVILRTTDAGSTWDQQASTTTADLHSLFFVDSDNGMVTGDGGLILKTINGGTPVELLSFSATRLDEHRVRLSWRTATELQNYGFDVQRRSDRNREWSTAGFVPGAGTTTMEQQYHFTGLAPATSAYEFRLQQIDFDGSRHYSPVIGLASTVPSGIELSQAFPNPVLRETAVLLTTGEDVNVTAEIVDISGTRVATLQDGPLPAGTHLLNWAPGAVASGIYFLHVHAGTQLLSRRLILQR